MCRQKWRRIEMALRHFQGPQKNMIPLFRLKLTHEYFGPLRKPPMTIVPTTATDRMAAKAGVRFFGDGAELTGCFAPDGLEPLHAYARDTVEPLSFHFIVRALDPLFFNYTEPPGLPENTVPQVTEAMLGSGPCRISGPLKGQGVTTVQAVARGVCAEMELTPLPLVLIRLDFSGEKGASTLTEAANGTPLQGTLAWSSRRTHWRYFIPCDGDEAHLTVEDTRGEVAFSPTAGRAPEGFRRYAGFISEQPLPLALGAPGRFQLKKTDQGRCRVLVKALPNAPADRLQGMEKGKQLVYVSDIFVHHYIHGR